MTRNIIYPHVVEYIKELKAKSEEASFTITALEVGKGISIKNRHKAISRAMLDEILKPYEILKIADKEDHYSSTTKIRYYTNEHWLIPANIKMYDYVSAFEEWGYVEWKQNNYKYKLGDIVYLYLSGDKQTIGYKCRVSKINQLFEDIIDDTKYWIDKEKEAEAQYGKYMRLDLIDTYDNRLFDLNHLKKHGLKSAPQGAMRIKGQLFDYLIAVQNESKDIIFQEGALKRVMTNQFERNPKARQACIEHYGYECQVCGLEFEKIYGEIGKNYIQVHHIVPVSKIAQRYEVDPIKDLIPVCANCHVMIHRKEEPIEYLELKENVRSNFVKE